MKSELYLETSVINYLFADHLPLEKKITERLFDSINRGENEGYISDLVIDEVLAAPEPKRTQLAEIVFGGTLHNLKVTEKTEKLAYQYIKAGAMTEKHKNDASHIAIATANNIEAIVSRNMDQIVRLSTKEVVDKVNEKLGYKPIYICTPREVI